MLKEAGAGDKLPDLGKLREEYSRLTEEKVRLYAEYGSLKNVCGDRNRTKPCSSYDTHTLFLNNLMCVRRFTVDGHTLFPYNIMCD